MSIGVVYQSEIEPEFDGDVKIDPVGIDVSTDTELSMPITVRLKSGMTC